MAVTKIKPVKVWLISVLDYIFNPSKTDEKNLVSLSSSIFVSLQDEICYNDLSFKTWSWNAK